MRAPKALLIPFKFREGYPDEIVDSFIRQAADLIAASGIEAVMAKAVVTDQDADEVAAAHNPTSFDFTILLFPTWFEPITAIRAATPFFQRPIVVWGFSNFQHEGQRVNLGSTAAPA